MAIIKVTTASGVKHYINLPANDESMIHWESIDEKLPAPKEEISQIVTPPGITIQDIPENKKATHFQLIEIDQQYISFTANNHQYFAEPPEDPTICTPAYVDSLLTTRGLNRGQLQSITIPESTIVAVGAFQDCTSLQIVNAPEATEIGVHAFMDCHSLQTVNLPEATKIDVEAFKNCSSLQAISLPKATKVDGYAFSSCTSLESIRAPKATEIGKHAFLNCKSLKSVSLPKATEIRRRAFQDCTSLQNINLPKPANICISSFIGCSGLKYLILSQGFEIIRGFVRLAESTKVLRCDPSMLKKDIPLAAKITHLQEIYHKSIKEHAITDQAEKKILQKTLMQLLNKEDILKPALTTLRHFSYKKVLYPRDKKTVITGALLKTVHDYLIESIDRLVDTDSPTTVSYESAKTAFAMLANPLIPLKPTRRPIPVADILHNRLCENFDFLMKPRNEFLLSSETDANKGGIKKRCRR